MDIHSRLPMARAQSLPTMIACSLLSALAIAGCSASSADADAEQETKARQHVIEEALAKVTYRRAVRAL